MPDIRELAASDNIAELLDGSWLAQIGTEVVDNFDADVQSRQHWERKQKEAMRLASQITEDKNHPWPGAANVKFPLLTEAAVQFNSRIYPALLPTIDLVKGRVVGFDPTGEKTNQAIRVSKHMTWQLTEEMEEWEEEMDRALLALPITGCFFKKTYYDANKGRNRSEAISAMDLVLDYFAKTVEDAHRKTHVLYYTENEYRKGILSGIFLEEDLGEPVVVPDVESADKDGDLPNIQKDDASRYTFLEQHTYLDLDEDDLAEPYIITVDKFTKKVLRIVAGFNLDDVIVDVKKNIIDVPQTQYFTKYGFIPNPDGGVYDIGFGQLLSPMNKTVDTLINQLLDAGTLSNMQAGFLARGVRLRGGVHKFQPGEWKTVDSRGDDLRKGVFPLPVREPSNVLYQLLGLMINTGQRLASTIDSMVGENPGQNQKATTTLAVLEQGQKVFNGIYKRLHRAFKKELQKLYALNSVHLPAESYLNVLDFPFMGDAETIKRNDYDLETVNVVPAADSNIATQQQKLMKAQALLELLPLGTVNPVEATRRILEAEEQPAIEILMNMPPRGPSAEEIKAQTEQADMQHRHQIEWANFSMDAIKAEQDELRLQADVILTIAKAEGEEVGAQIDQYKAQLDKLAERSQTIQERLNEFAKGAPTQEGGEMKEEPEEENEAA